MVIPLELRAFANDPRRRMNAHSEAVTITLKCKSQHCEVLPQLVRNAWGVQQRLLENHVLAEERLGILENHCLDHGFQLACRCLALRWNQWQEDTFYAAVTNVWRRALESYHLWVGQPRDARKDVVVMFQETLLFYTLQAVAEQVMHCPEIMNTFFHLLLAEETGNILRYDLLCKIIDEYIHNSDPFYTRGLTLDDINDAVPRRLGNTTLEELEKRLKYCTYKGFFMSKMYPARGIAAAIKLTMDFRPAFELKGMIGVLAYSVFSEDLSKRPMWLFNNWAFYHAGTLAVAELLTIWNLGYIHSSSPRRREILNRCLGLLVALGIFMIYTVMPDADFATFVGPGFLSWRVVYLTLLRNTLPVFCFRAQEPFPQGPKDPKPKFDSEGATAPFLKRLLYWVVVLGFCFVMEIYMVFPVMQGLSFDSLCSSRCHPLLWRSECVACNMSMFILYLMLASMLFIDVFMGHVLFTSVIGIVLGTQRGLNGMRKAPDSAVFLSDSNLGVGENNPRAGKLMQRVFGHGWRHTWNLICYRLWKEDLLSSSEADELMQMASKNNSEKNPDAPVYLHTLHPVVRERFTFFFASLRTICEDRLRMEENPPISHHGIFRTHDIMPLSQVLPAVNEEVILQDGFLTSQNGMNLRWIIMKYPKEWQRLTARLAESNLLLRYLGKAQPGVSDKTRIEVRLWASMRSQTVMRTVQGAVNYHIALEANPTIVSPHSAISKRQQLEKYVELIWSHQTHGEDNKKDSDVRRLLGLYEDLRVVKMAAQRAFGQKHFRLITGEKRVLVNFEQTLEEAQIKDGECLTVLLLQPQLTGTSKAFALWCHGDSAIVTWGGAEFGGDSSAVQDQLRGVQQIQATFAAFAAILADGSVVTWGHEEDGGDSSAVQDQLRGVQQIQATFSAFAAILADGSVVTWGDARSGGDSSAVQDQLRGVQQIQRTGNAFAAILADGSVVTWGHEEDGGDSSAVQDQLRGVQQIQATFSAFAAILADGSVVTWGNHEFGGDSSAVRHQLRGVQQIQRTGNAFAAILADGSVVTWGDARNGGDSSAVQDQLRGVQQIQVTLDPGAFAAILADGSVVTWGYEKGGGDSSAVQDQLRRVQQIQRTERAFAAILADGSVVTWGDEEYGGDSSAVQDQLQGVQQIQCTLAAFAAILADGSVVTWGNHELGGDSSAVQHQLRGVQQIQRTGYAFAAILADGSVVTWGHGNEVGDSSAIL
eukprot:symbB.v1.2.028590.t1/scaffold3043.1/size64820/3